MMRRFKIYVFLVVCAVFASASWRPHASPARDLGGDRPKRGNKIKDPIPHIPGGQKSKDRARGFRPSAHDPPPPSEQTMAKQERLKQLLDSVRLTSGTPEDYERKKQEVWGE